MEQKQLFFFFLRSEGPEENTKAPQDREATLVEKATVLNDPPGSDPISADVEKGRQWAGNKLLRFS